MSGTDWKREKFPMYFLLKSFLRLSNSSESFSSALANEAAFWQTFQKRRSPFDLSSRPMFPRLKASKSSSR